MDERLKVIIGMLLLGAALATVRVCAREQMRRDRVEAAASAPAEAEQPMVKRIGERRVFWFMLLGLVGVGVWVMRDAFNRTGRR